MEIDLRRSATARYSSKRDFFVDVLFVPNCDNSSCAYGGIRNRNDEQKLAY